MSDRHSALTTHTSSKRVLESLLCLILLVDSQILALYLIPLNIDIHINDFVASVRRFLVGRFLGELEVCSGDCLQFGLKIGNLSVVFLCDLEFDISCVTLRTDAEKIFKSC